MCRECYTTPQTHQPRSRIELLEHREASWKKNVLFPQNALEQVDAITIACGSFKKGSGRKVLIGNSSVNNNKVSECMLRASWSFRDLTNVMEQTFHG